jgi:hypothetical protein
VDDEESDESTDDEGFDTSDAAGMLAQANAEQDDDTKK